MLQQFYSPYLPCQFPVYLGCLNTDEAHAYCTWYLVIPGWYSQHHSRRALQLGLTTGCNISDRLAAMTTLLAFYGHLLMLANCQNHLGSSI